MCIRTCGSHLGRFCPVSNLWNTEWCVLIQYKTRVVSHKYLLTAFRLRAGTSIRNLCFAGIRCSWVNVVFCVSGDASILVRTQIRSLGRTEVPLGTWWCSSKKILKTERSRWKPPLWWFHSWSATIIWKSPPVSEATTRLLEGKTNLSSELFLALGRSKAMLTFRFLNAMIMCTMASWGKSSLARSCTFIYWSSWSTQLMRFHVFFLQTSQPENSSSFLKDFVCKPLKKARECCTTYGTHYRWIVVARRYQYTLKPRPPHRICMVHQLRCCMLQKSSAIKCFIWICMSRQSPFNRVRPPLSAEIAPSVSVHHQSANPSIYAQFPQIFSPTEYFM